MSGIDMGLFLTAIGLIPLYVGLVPLYLDLLSRRKVDFYLLRYQYFNDADAEKFFDRIRTYHPNKAIERCSVFYNDTRLVWDYEPLPNDQKFIEKMTLADVRLPSNVLRKVKPKDGIVVVKDGKRIIRKMNFLDIPFVNEQIAQEQMKRYREKD
ncbi:MAG: hypothetical protein ABSF44_13670 [Candidatus Bathyarchaeia archaeon]